MFGDEEATLSFDDGAKRFEYFLLTNFYVSRLLRLLL